MNDESIKKEKTKNLNEARDKYVRDHLRDMMFNMKEVDVPKGVWLSTAMMSAPLFSFTFYLACMSLFV